MRTLPARILLLLLWAPTLSGQDAPWNCLTHSLPGSGDARAVRGDTPAADVGDDGCLVDVLFVHTSAAIGAAGGEAALSAFVDGQIDFANQARADSGVHHRVRLVHLEQVAYTESGNIITDVTRLKDPSDGFLDAVHPLRDLVGADLVCLVVDSGSAGVGFVPTNLGPSADEEAFSVISAVAAPVVFAHESGHNMGLHHNNEPPPPAALFCDSFGHRTPDEAFRTIMSNPPGERLDLFSSPALSHMGQPLGVDGSGCPPGAADAVRSLNAAALAVSNFRPSVDAGNAFIDLGGALAGATGDPFLHACGELAVGSPGSLVLTDAAPSAAALLFASLGSAPVPFKGGSLQAFPVAGSLLLFTDADAAIGLSWSAWPPGVPSGSALVLQYAISDGGAPAGVALSNAVSGAVP